MVPFHKSGHMFVVWTHSYTTSVEGAQEYSSILLFSYISVVMAIWLRICYPL